MKIQLLHNNSFPEDALMDLLNNYHLEDFYLKTLKPDIDMQQFIKFKVSRIHSAVKSGKRVWQVVDNANRLKAVFGLQRNSARCKNFGMEYYELNPMFNFSEDAGKALNCFEQEVLLPEVKMLKIQYIKSKINALDHQNIAAFTKANYSFFATSLNFYLAKERYKPSNRSYDEVELIAANDTYIDEIREILFQHNHSEDYYDTEINHQKTQANFYDWLATFYLTEKARATYNTEMLLLYHKKDAKIAGFTCYTKEPNFSKRFNLQLITRDLTVIPKEYHNKGYGSLLFSEIFKRENKNVELKLLANNYKAIGFNQHNGFKCVNSAHFFRKTFNHQLSVN